MNSTCEIPSGLSDILGAYDTLHHETVVAELKPNSGILLRGTVLSDSSGADAGKLVAATVGNEGQVYGILLDANVDTAQAFSDSSVTGSIARAGSFKGPKLIVGVGTNVSTLTDALRKNGIYVEGAIVAPLAAAMPSETEATPTA
jgi:hypothetical protein